MSAANAERLVMDIEAMDLAELREMWRKRYGPPPALRSEPLMRALLAWRVQAEAFGGLNQQVRRAIARKGAPQSEGLDLGIGARITRNWKGHMVEVIVEERGFRYNGTVYRSLSAAASAIAGSKWNGPRFFGLREAAWPVSGFAAQSTHARALTRALSSRSTASMPGVRQHNPILPARHMKVGSHFPNFTMTVDSRAVRWSGPACKRCWLMSIPG